MVPRDRAVTHDPTSGLFSALPSALSIPLLFHSAQPTCALNPLPSTWSSPLLAPHMLPTFHLSLSSIGPRYLPNDLNKQPTPISLTPMLPIVCLAFIATETVFIIDAPAYCLLPWQDLNSTKEEACLSRSSLAPRPVHRYATSIYWIDLDVLRVNLLRSCSYGHANFCLLKCPLHFP